MIYIMLLVSVLNLQLTGLSVHQRVEECWRPLESNMDLI